MGLAHGRYINCIHAVPAQQSCCFTGAEVTVCVQITWRTCTADSLSMRCITHILTFLYKISWMKVMRHTGKSERISQIPVRKMAGMSISTPGSVIPLTIHTHYNHTTGRSWDKYTLQAISIYRLFILTLDFAYLILRPLFSVWERISVHGLLA